MKQSGNEYTSEGQEDIKSLKNELETAQESLKYKEGLLNTVLELAHEGFCVTDEKGFIVDVNPAFCVLYGYTHDELIGNNISIIDANYKEGTELESGFQNDCIAVKKDGSHITVNKTTKILEQAEGKRLEVTSFSVVTKKRQEIYALEEVNQRYAYVTKATFDAIWDWNLITDEVYWGEGFETIFGFDLEKVKPDSGSWKAHIHPDDVKEVIQSIESVIQPNEDSWSYEYRFQKADGTYAYVADRGIVIRDKEGKGIRMIGAMQDISQQREEKQYLKLLESVITNTNDAVLITEAEPLGEPGPRILYVNEAFARMTGYSAEEVIGKTPRMLQGPESDQAELKKLGEALRRSEPYEVTTINYKKNGEKFWVNFSVSPVMNVQSKATHFIAIERDVTQSKHAEFQKTIMAEASQLFSTHEYLSEALQEVLKRLFSLENFIIAEAWLVDTNESKIKLTAHHLQDQVLQDFYEADNIIQSFSPGEGLPGITWQSKSFQYWEDIQNYSGFKRSEGAREAGLKAALGIPLLHHDKVVGVLVLGVDRNEQPKESFSKLFIAIGEHLGTELKRKQLEQELTQIFYFAPDILALGRLNGYFIKINKSMSQLLEYSEEEILTTHYIDFLHPEDRERTIEEAKKLEDGLQSIYLENRWTTKSGKVKWLAWSVTLFSDENLVFIVAKDISEKKELEELLYSAVNLARIGSWEVNLLNNSLYWSPMVRELHEVEEDYKPDLDSAINFYRKDMRDKVQASIEECILSGKSFDFELPIVTAKGNERWVRSIGEAEFLAGKCIRLYGSFQDIHQRKIAELRLKVISENIPGVIFRYRLHPDGTDKITFVSKGAQRVWGVSPEQGMEDNQSIWSQIKAGGDFSIVQQTITTSAQNMSPWHCQWRNVLPDGRICWHEGQGIPQLLPDGSIVWDSLIMDITESKKIEIALQKTYDEKNEILESIGDAFFAVDHHWTVTYWNRMAEGLLSMPREMIVGKNLWEGFPEAIELSFYENYHRAMKEGVNVHFEEYYHPIGRWFEVSAYPSTTGISVFFRDNTERKIAEEQIRLSSERFEKISEATNDAIWDYDVKKNKLFWGKGFSTLFQYDLTKVKPSIELLLEKTHPDDRNRIAQKIEQFMGDISKTNWFEEYRFLKADGSYTYVMDRAIFIRDEYGQVIRVVGAMTDISYQKEYEASLKRLNLQLKKYTRMLEISNADLEQFAYVASHDLQEPLRMISSFLTQIERKYGPLLDEKGKKYIDFAVDGAKRMRQIILDLLEFSRVGRLEDKAELVDLNEVVQEVKALYRKSIHESKARIEFEGLPNVLSYRSPLSQLFQNLISNALKYRKKEVPPVIKIVVEEKKDHWHFAVADNGIGIEPEYFEKIFFIFQRLHHKEEYFGTGMGLAVSKKIVESLGGEIWLESELNKGSTFYFTIPKAKQ